MPSLTAVAQTEKMPATDEGAGIFLDVQVVVLKRWQFTNVVNTRHNRFLRL
jgi:hypothetical protein